MTLIHTTAAELKDELSGRHGIDTIRVEDQNGRLLGNVVTDVYRMENVYAGTPGEKVLVIAVDVVPDADEPEPVSHSALVEAWTWYDSPDAGDRRRSVSYWRNRAEGAADLGNVFYCERAEPGDVWPPPVLVAEQVSLGEATRLAHAKLPAGSCYNGPPAARG